MMKTKTTPLSLSQISWGPLEETKERSLSFVLSYKSDLVRIALAQYQKIEEEAIDA